MNKQPLSNNQSMEMLRPQVGQTVWAQVGSVIDGISSAPIKNGHVVYNDQEILYVGPEHTLPPAALYLLLALTNIKM